MSDQDAREPYRMVIGIDFEKTGDDALREGLRIAREHPNDVIHAVHVVKLGKSTSAKKLDAAADRMESAAAVLTERVYGICEELFPGKEWVQDIYFHVRVGDAAEALHQVAVDYDAHLIIVGTHARTGIGKLLLGSVAERLMKLAHLPVLVARPRTLGTLEKSSRADERREGEVLHDENYARGERVTFGHGGRHIAYLV